MARTTIILEIEIDELNIEGMVELFDKYLKKGYIINHSWYEKMNSKKVNK